MRKKMTGEEFLQSKDIWNHPRLGDRNNTESHDVAELLDEYASHYREGGVNITDEKVRALFNAKRNCKHNDIYGVALMVTGGYEYQDSYDRSDNRSMETLSFSEEELALEMDEIVPHYEEERKEAYAQAGDFIASRPSRAIMF